MITTRTIIGTACVLIVVLLFLGAPKSLLKDLGAIVFPRLKGYRPFSPNWLTLYSVIISFLGIWVYTIDVLGGLVLITIGGLLDRIDGKMAFVMGKILSPPATWEWRKTHNAIAPVTENGRTEKRNIGRAKTRLGLLWFEFNFGGSTDWGKIFDPMGDKAKILALLAIFADRGWLAWWLLGIMLAPELLGTLVRRPFRLWEDKFQDSKATAIGKYKVLFQWIAIILCIPYDQHWLIEGHWAIEASWLPDVFLTLAAVFSIFSCVSRLKWFHRHRELRNTRRLMKKVAKATGHE